MQSSHLQKAAASGAVMIGLNSYVSVAKDSSVESNPLSKGQLKRGAAQAVVSYFANDIQRLASEWVPFLTQYTGSYSKEIWTGIVYAVIVRMLEGDKQFRPQQKDFVRALKSAVADYVAQMGLEKMGVQQ